MQIRFPCKNLWEVDKIVRQASKDWSNTSVIEIGPGPGGLTRSLLTNGACQIVAIEKDERFRPFLEQLEEASDGRLKVLYGDALTVAHEEVLPKFTNPDLAKQGRIHYIGNLPFAVARGITISLLQQISKREGFFAPGFQTQMSFMFQKEVGKLICAPPGVYERKRLSVLVQSLCDAHSVYDVPASVFVPRPQVDAAVVHFKPLQDPFSKDVSFDTLSLVLRYGFDRPSRMLKQGLADLTKEIRRSNPAVYGNMSTRDLVLKLLKHADVPPFRRARAASIEEWVRVAKATDELMKKY